MRKSIGSGGIMRWRSREGRMRGFRRCPGVALAVVAALMLPLWGQAPAVDADGGGMLTAQAVQTSQVAPTTALGASHDAAVANREGKAPVRRPEGKVNPKSAAPSETASMQVAFIRDGNLWLKQGEQETQLTQTGEAVAPKWSIDGKWIAYREGKMLYAYSLLHKQSYPVDEGAVDYQWSPTENVLAYNKERKELHVADLREGVPHGQNKLASSISEFGWLPDGSGFIAGKSSEPDPSGEGWTQAVLYKIFWDWDVGEVVTEKFLTLPNEVQSGKNNVMAVYASHFRWSEDGQWMAFIVSPTASLAMDSNVLCAVSADGKQFYPLDEILVHQNDWLQWAPARNWLGYIGGGGRFVFSESPKDMKIQEMPTLKAAHDLTPKGVKDIGFTWHDPHVITVSRLPIYVWNNDPEKRPLPALWQINLHHGHQQKQLTHPGKRSGDYDPKFLRAYNKLTWVHYTRRPSAELWMSDPDGANARAYVQGLPASKLESEEWDGVVSIYDPLRRRE